MSDSKISITDSIIATATITAHEQPKDVDYMVDGLYLNLTDESGDELNIRNLKDLEVMVELSKSVDVKNLTINHQLERIEGLENLLVSILRIPTSIVDDPGMGFSKQYEPRAASSFKDEMRNLISKSKFSELD